MKKFLALIVIFFYCTMNASLAVSELYYLKNIQQGIVQTIVENNYAYQGFNIQKQNPTYGKDKEGNYAVVVLQQTGDNVFYYYESNDNTKLNKNILRDLRRLNVTYEQSMNSNILSSYHRLAQDARANVAETYTFEEPVKLQVPQPIQQEVSDDTTFRGYVAQLASGTQIPAYLQNAINTSTASKGDQIVAVTTQNIVHNGHVIIPQGSFIYGTLTKARNATYGSRNGAVVIEFTTIVTPENKQYDISAEQIDFKVTNDGKLAESAKSAVVGAALGALVGLLFAAMGDTSLLSGAAIGAGVGVGASAVGSVAERGIDAEIPSFTELEITLTRPLNVSVSY